MVKRKIATLAILSALSIAGITGASTYALFSSASSNTGNTFTAGTLSLSSERDDVPITGPMFYTDSNESGWSGTGYWAPGDNHTRGLFVKNTGSLDGKLTKTYAIPKDPPGTTEYANEVAFANQAEVTIAAYAPVGNFDQTAYRQLMEIVDDWYKNAVKDAMNNGTANVDDYINQAFLHQVFYVKNVLGQDVSASVKQIYTGKMSELLNGKDSPIQASVASGGTLLLGYTVYLPLTTGNDLQGKEVYFNFKNDFVQAKNN